MKKFFVLALLLIVISTGAFAMDRTIGAGGAWRNIEDLSGFGFFAFFGPGRFVELSLGFSTYTWSDYYGSGSFQTAQVGFYLKYPFVLSNRIVLFPTAGAELEYEFEYEDIIFWLLFGGGIDFYMTEKLFLRGHVLLGRGQVEGYSGFGQSVKLGLGWMF